MVIVLDPGHGGDNSGLTYNGLTEKYMTRATAQAMKEELEQYNGVTVYITDPDPEKDLSLADRAEYAKSVDADVLISLHYNMSEEHRMFGSEAWIPSKGRAYADMRSLGDVFMDEFREQGLTIRGVKTRLGSGGADYYGIIRESASRELPCILVEHCHADHARDFDYCDTEADWVAFGKTDATAVAKYYHLKSDTLGVDYSDFIKNGYFAPEQAVSPDATGPTAVSLQWIEEKSVSENGICRDVQTFHLQGNEEETSIVYYDYSLDGGATWSDAQPFADGETQMDIEIPNVLPGNHVVARLFNGQFISGKSNTITFQDAPETEEVAPDRDLVSVDTALGLTKDSYENMASYMSTGWIWAVVALLMSALSLISFFKSGKKKRKLTRDEDNIPVITEEKGSPRKQGIFLALTVFLIISAFMPVALLSLSMDETSRQVKQLEKQHEEVLVFNEENEKLRYEQERISKELIMTDAGTVDGEYVAPTEQETVVVYDIAKGFMRVPLVEGAARNTLNMDGFSGSDLTKTYSGGAEIGIDVSKFQGEIDWEKVAASGVKFVIIRIGTRAYGSGELVLDDKFYDNIEGAQAVGIKTGVYFFSTAISEKEAVEEADFVMDTLDGYTLQMPVVFDTELITYADDARNRNMTPNQLTAVTKAFCERIKNAGMTPMIYSNAKRFTTVLHLEELEAYQKWFADYRDKPDYPYAFSMWQFTEHGSVPGISGDVDINLWFTGQ
ncbi:MAG: N-acetylmuramoyl-L-alanine amidase [Lachnospiraceae bacterium]|nr:N-acetylmuramoyl-L-alanine amidase [Lachnospiraceae bacterium]